jgi:aerobic carbon-monoxide dehydrogenase medium subunit
MMKTGLYQPRRLVSLRALGRALTMIAATPEGGLDIGAMVRLAQIERSAVVRQAAPVVADTLLTHSNVRVRNVATVGGNLAHGDPHMDLPPVLIALARRYGWWAQAASATSRWKSSSPATRRRCSAMTS